MTELDFLEDLKKLKGLVRAGSSAYYEGTEVASDLGLEERTDIVIKKLEDNEIGKSTNRVFLQFLTLKAEFYYLFGRDGSAVAELDNLVSQLCLRERLRIWVSKSVSELGYVFEANADKLRLEIWALMAVLFYRDYLNGAYEDVLRDLRTIEKLIERDLANERYNPDGSRARINYFIGQCLRSMGKFKKADEHFLKAQVFAGRRLTRELEAADLEASPLEKAKKLKYEYQFGIICTARVLGSVGRNAMLQGRLRRALQNFYAAATLLAGSEQIPLRLVIESHIAIAECRLLQDNHKLWYKWLGRIEECYEQFQIRGDLDGMGRCAQELARTYIYRAENLPHGHPRTTALESADLWTSRLEELAAKRAELNRAGTDRFRAHLLRALLHLLRPNPDWAEADRLLREARSLDPEDLRRHHLDRSGFDNIDRHIVEGMFVQMAIKNRWPTDPRDRSFPEAETASDYFQSLNRKARSWRDPVLQAEVSLRMVISEIEDGRELEAQGQIQDWLDRTRTIENAYLGTLYRRALRSLTVPRYEFDPSKLNFRVQIDEAEEFICNWAVAHYQSDAQAERALKLNRGRLRELREKWADNRSTQA